MTPPDSSPALRELTALIVAAAPEIMNPAHPMARIYHYMNATGPGMHNQGRPITLSDVFIVLMKAGCYFTFNHNFRLAVVDKHNIDHGSVEFLPEYPLDDQDPEVHSFLLSLLSPSKGN